MLIAALMLAGAAAAAPPPYQTQPPEGYALVFADEFDGAGLPSPERWTYDTERNAIGWHNDERQYYAADRPENARLENGVLVIEARAETLDTADYPDHGGQAYSSARMMTRDRAAWTYGFFEIRAKLPCARGSWPAIWMLPADPTVKWPDGGEIDIMEHVGYDPGVIHQSVHGKTFNFARGTQKTTKFDLPSACSAYHRYQLLWKEDFLVFGVDDEPRFLFRKRRGGDASWPFDKPMYLLLNIAVGGSWGGRKGIDDAAFPARMEVDYVRVYQPADSEKKP